MDLKLLYGENADIQSKIDRIERLKDVFFTSEGYNPTHVFSSPGRAEILGNHTDHNHGLVMVASITCDVIACVKKRDDTIVKIYSYNYPPVEVDISDVLPKRSEIGSSNALVRGVARAIKDRSFEVKGFTAYTTSNIFKGAGVSTSAAFEVLTCEIFNVLYLGGKLSSVDKAVISQYAENVYFGKPCGILDQSGISIGSLIKLDFNNPTKPTVKNLNPPKGYTLVITNTGGSHSQLTSHYAQIRKDMEEIAGYFGKKVLRDVPKSDFIKSLPTLKRRYSGRAVMRAMHFYRKTKG